MTKVVPLAKKISLRKKTMADTNVKQLEDLTPGQATTALAKALAGTASPAPAEAPASAPAPAQAPATAPSPATARSPATAPAATPSIAPAPKPPATAPAASQPVVLHTWLKQILSTRRRHNSQGDLNFRKWLTATLEAMGHKVSLMHSNMVVVIKPKGKKANSLLFSCHVDTCHREFECTGQNQALMYDKAMEYLSLSTLDNNKNTIPMANMPGCLGADDGAGIYILLRMIEAKKPGTYIFHVGEEVGCIGSNAMQRNEGDWLKQFTHAIAFDRKGTEDIIITQSGQRCASTECGDALAKAINNTHADLNMSISHNGSVTDVKLYAGLIEECINVAVGYENAHSSSEELNVAHLERLAEACVKINWAELPVARKCVEPFQGGRTVGGYGGYGDDDDAAWMRRMAAGSGSGGGYANSGHASAGRYGNGAAANGARTGGNFNGRGERDLFDERYEAPSASKAPARRVEAPVEIHPVDWLMTATVEDISDWFLEEGEEAARGMMMLVARHKGLLSQIKALEDAL